MMDWTDRHCRVFHRVLSRHAFLYSEMVTSRAIEHGDHERLLGFAEQEHPLVLQLGGNDPAALARAALAGQRFGYDEINLNCGCPSDRVQDGAFGACLMLQPDRVAECIKSMRDAVSIPVTVKHRIGIGRDERYEFVHEFVDTVAKAGCELFIVHARNAWLEGLSPKENRQVPPLRYDYVYRLKRDFPELRFVLNGGLKTLSHSVEALADLDGVMLGRAAYDDPWLLREVDQFFGGERENPLTRREVVGEMVDYARGIVASGGQLRWLTRHMLGLCNGLHGARLWRRTLSDSKALRENDPDLLWRAFDHVTESK